MREVDCSSSSGADYVLELGDCAPRVLEYVAPPIAQARADRTSLPRS